MASRIMPGSVNSAVEDDNNIALIDLDKVAEKLGKTARMANEEPEEKEKGGFPFDKKKKSVAPEKDQGGKCKCDPNCKCNGKCKCADGCTCGSAPKEAQSVKGFAIPSAAYIRDAEKRGDLKAKEEALQVRSAFRKNYLSKLAAIVDAEEDKNNLIEENQNERQKIIAEVEKREVVARKEARKELLAKAVASQKAKTTKTAAPVRKEVSDFVGVKDMNDLTKEIVRKRLVKAGLDPNMANIYTKYALNESQDVPEFVSNLVKMEAPKEQKTALFNSWVKEAKLDDADRSRLRDYWANELGYQDKEWVDDLVTNYDKDGK